MGSQFAYFGVPQNILLIFHLAGVLLVVILWYILRVERRFHDVMENDEKLAGMLSILSVQLRSPITMVGWYSQLMLSQDFGTLKVAQIEALDKIQRGAEAANGVLNRLLELSRFDRGHMTVKPVALDVAKELRKAVDVLQSEFENKEQLVGAPKDEQPLLALTDPIVFHSAMATLLSNASAYTKTQGMVTVACFKQGRNIIVNVQDTGIGIPADERRYMFTKFFRGKEAKLMAPAGNGLSLYLIKGLLATTGATVSFTSTPGQGSTFTVTMPAA